MKANTSAASLGFGCAAIPGPLTAREALTLLETAHVYGVRHFDTARMYGSGNSETVLGELVRQHRAGLTLVTKAGIEPTSRLVRGLTKLGLPAPSRLPANRFAPARIRRSVETSLRRLKTERVDAVLLHEIRSGEVHDELKGQLEDLRTAGKIGGFGIATSIEQSETLIAAHPELCGIVQVPVQWFDRPRTLPPNAQLIVHSVLSTRLAEFVNRLRAEAHLARRFKEETGLTAADAGHIGRLMLQAAMLRNANGVVLFASARLERIRHNAELLTAKLDTPLVHALERAMRTPKNARFDHEAAP